MTKISLNAVLYTIYLSVYIGMLTACTNSASLDVGSSIQEITPTSMPEYIKGWELASDGSFYIYLDDAHIWRSGDEAGDILDTVLRTAQVNVDNTLVSNIQIGALAITISKYDENNQIVGSYNGGIQLSFNTVALQKGRHTVSLSFESTAGERFNHTWTFEL